MYAIYMESIQSLDQIQEQYNKINKNYRSLRALRINALRYINSNKAKFKKEGYRKVHIIMMLIDNRLGAMEDNSV